MSYWHDMYIIAPVDHHINTFFRSFTVVVFLIGGGKPEKVEKTTVYIVEKQKHSTDLTNRRSGVCNVYTWRSFGPFVFIAFVQHWPWIDCLAPAVFCPTLQWYFLIIWMIQKSNMAALASDWPTQFLLLKLQQPILNYKRQYQYHKFSYTLYLYNNSFWLVKTFLSTIRWVIQVYCIIVCIIDVLYWLVNLEFLC